MTCDIVQQELCVLPYGDLSELPAGAEKHLAQCECCAAFLVDLGRADAQMEKLLSVNTAVPPPALQDRIARAIESAARPTEPTLTFRTTATEHGTAGFTSSPSEFEFAFTTSPRAWRQRLRRIATVAACAVIGLWSGFAIHGNRGMLMAASAAVERMSAAYGQVNSVHITYWSNRSKDGRQSSTLQKEEEVWRAGDHQRKEGIWGSSVFVERPHGVTLPDGSHITSTGDFYHYDRVKGRIVKYDETAPQPVDYSVKGMIGVAPDDPALHAEVVSTTEVAGRRIQEIDLAPNADHNRNLCWIDTATNLPVRIDDQEFTGGKWVTYRRYDFEFNRPLPPSLFDPKTLPHGAPLPPSAIPHRATIDELRWSSDPTILPAMPLKETDLMARIAEWKVGDASEAWSKAIGGSQPEFVLRTDGAPNVPVTWDNEAYSYTASNGSGFFGIGLKIAQADRDKLRPGGVYRLIPTHGKDRFTWAAAPSLTVTVPAGGVATAKP